MPLKPEQPQLVTIIPVAGVQLLAEEQPLVVGQLQLEQREQPQQLAGLLARKLELVKVVGRRERRFQWERSSCHR